jgi:hypothetical protein
MPTETALGSSPSSILWFSISCAPDTHHLTSLITPNSLEVLQHLLPLSICQHRRDGTQPRERRLSRRASQNQISGHKFLATELHSSSVSNQFEDTFK